MARWDFIFEIEGLDTAFVGTYLSGAPTSWATTLVEAILDAVPLQTMGVDPMSGNFQHGGFAVRLGTAAALIQNRTESPKTYLTANATAIATTITVADTTGFPSSGTIWLGKEAIPYTGKTSTTFTGCVRGQLGTTASSHSTALGLAGTKNYVYGFCPNLEGRKCFIRRYDPNVSSPSATTIAAGLVDAILFDEDGFEISVVSIGQRLEEPSIVSDALPHGILRGAIVSQHNGYYVLGDMSPQASTIFVAYEDEPFFDVSQYAWVMIEDELVRYDSKSTPTDTVISTGSDSFGPYMRVRTQVPWQVGDIITFEDSATTTDVQVAITRITSTSGILTLYYNEATYAPAGGASVTPVNILELSALRREYPVEHERGAEVQQVLVLDEDHVDSVLIGLGSGNGSGAWYDVLPDGVGAAIPAAEIDFDSFDSLRPYSLPRRVILREEIRPKDLLMDLASVTGGRIYISEEGLIAARRDFSPYPDLASTASIGIDEALSIPSWQSTNTRLANYWRWPTVEGSAVFRVEDSIDRHRLRPMPEPRSELISLGDFGLIESIALSTLLRYSEPAPEVVVEIAHNDTFLRPGQIVAFTMPHLPDQAGGSGYTSELFEVIEFAPGSGGQATVRLLRLPQAFNVGLFAPAGIVTGVSTNDVTIQAAATSHLAPSSVSSALSAILGGSDGTEDADWFLADDPIQFIDVSTLGNATPTTATTTISSINYATRVLTVAAAPGWLAAGDIVRLDTHATVKAGATASSRVGYFVAWSNATPELPNGDTPYLWGI